MGELALPRTVADLIEEHDAKAAGIEEERRQFTVMLRAAEKEG